MFHSYPFLSRSGLDALWLTGLWSVHWFIHSTVITMLSMYYVSMHMWLVILWVNLTGQNVAQIVGKALFLGVIVRVSLEEISIWSADWVKKMILANGGGHDPILWGSEYSIKAEQGQNFSLCLSWNLSSLPLGYQLWFSGLQSRVGAYTIGPSPLLSGFGLRSNYTTSFSGSAACRQQSMGLLNPHDHLSQFLW